MKLEREEMLKITTLETSDRVKVVDLRRVAVASHFENSSRRYNPINIERTSTKQYFVVS